MKVTVEENGVTREGNIEKDDIIGTFKEFSKLMGIGLERVDAFTLNFAEMCMSTKTEFEIGCIDSLIRVVKEFEEEKKHSSEDAEARLKNVLHNCVIRLEELKAIKVGLNDILDRQ